MQRQFDAVAVLALAFGEVLQQLADEQHDRLVPEDRGGLGDFRLDAGARAFPGGAHLLTRQRRKIHDLVDRRTGVGDDVQMLVQPFDTAGGAIRDRELLGDAIVGDVRGRHPDVPAKHGQLVAEVVPKDAMDHPGAAPSPL